MVTAFKTIAKVSTAIHKVLGSRHLAFAFPVTNEEEIKSHIAALWKEHHSATHICYAWRLSADMKHFRSNDDREPSGTAGKPILGQIQSFALTNVLVCVVRYFGGTKLGTGGLVDAYKTAAKLALESAVIVEKEVTETWHVQFAYELLNNVMKLVKELKLEKQSITLEDEYKLQVKIPVALKSEVEKRLGEMQGVRFTCMKND